MSESSVNIGYKSDPFIELIEDGLITSRDVVAGGNVESRHCIKLIGY